MNIPLGYLGGAKSLANAEQAVQSGFFDAVVMARALIQDPGLINKFHTGKADRALCTSCNRCVPYIYHPACVWCWMNPPNSVELNQVRAAS